MKIGRTLIILWVASIALFTTAGIVTLLSPELMNSFPGLIMRFVLGYCAIIVVAQVFSAMRAIRKLLDELSAGKSFSFRSLLR